MYKMKLIASGVLAAACILAVLPLVAQTAPNMPARDFLRPLKRALEAAGAPALTATQETQLNTLISDFRTSNTPQPPSSAVQAARLAYENAIVSGDLNGAGTQIKVLVDDRVSRENARMTAVAKFAISALSVLGTNPDQTKLLLKQFGNRGVVRMIESLAGGPGMGNRRMGGPGMPVPRMQGYVGRKN